MSRYFIPAIILAAAPLSLAAAEPDPAPEATAPANCQQMQQMHQSGGQGGMQQHMDGAAMNGSGHMMQHGTDGMGTGHMDHGNMGNGAMGSGSMQGRMMQNGTGNDHAMMQGQGQCPAASPPPGNQSEDDK